MSNKMTEKKIREAKAKLACHIEPPKGSPYAEMLAQSGLSSDAPSESPSAAAPSCGAAPAPVQGNKIRLTEMTSAGG